MVTIFGKPTPQHTEPSPSPSTTGEEPTAALTPEETLYRERAYLVAFLAAYYPSSAGYTDERTPEWLVVTVELPEGQASWHISAADEYLFEHVPRHDTLWDGHTTAEKYARVARCTAALAARRALNEEGW